jgi:CRISPR-associated protein Csy1
MPTASATSLRSRITEFLDERLEAKLAGIGPEDPKRGSLHEKFQRETWIADAARRVSQLQLVTHVAKATHPDSKGSSLYVPPGSLPDYPLVGSHLLGEDFDVDVVGNAAALDVFKFLKIEHEGRSLLARALDGEPALAHAFSDDPDQGMEWVRCFARITEPRDDIRSDPRAKQVYWLVGDDPADDSGFHLLSPLYSTILAHRAYQTLTDDRFSEDAREVRKVYRAGEYSGKEYREYPELAVLKFGGSKPQNISQLNSERGGNNYFLASLPPNWKTRDVRPILHTDSAFTVFQRRSEVHALLNRLRRFLQSDPDATMETREQRDADVSALIDHLIIFTHKLHMLDPGWSADNACRLSNAQALWLDPGRGTMDPDFAERRRQGEWVAEVCDRFAAWLNRRLGKQFPVGDAEHEYWQTLLKRETGQLEEVLPHA